MRDGVNEGFSQHPVVKTGPSRSLGSVSGVADHEKQPGPSLLPVCAAFGFGACPSSRLVPCVGPGQVRPDQILSRSMPARMSILVERTAKRNEVNESMKRAYILLAAIALVLAGAGPVLADESCSISVSCPSGGTIYCTASGISASCNGAGGGPVTCTETVSCGSGCIRTLTTEKTCGGGDEGGGPEHQIP